MEKLETKIKNLTFITVLGFVLLGVLIIGLYFKGDSKKNTTNTNNSGTQSSAELEYDKVAANFKSVTAAQALDLFNQKGTYVLYIGRNDCSVCQSYVSVLKEVQDDLNIKANYYDLNTAKNFKTELKDLSAKFTVKTTANNEKDTIGNLFIKYGYTPTTVIIKDGKCVDGFIGYRNKDKMKELISKYL